MATQAIPFLSALGGLGSLFSNVGGTTSIGELNPIGIAYRANKVILESIDWYVPNTFEVLLMQKTELNAFGPDVSRVTTAFSSKMLALNADQKSQQQFSGALNIVMTRFHMRSISFGLAKFEYETLNWYKRVKNITHPDTVTFTLLEDEYGTVKKYISSWMQMIAHKTSDGRLIFMDNQLLQEKDGYIMIQMGSGLPNLWQTIDLQPAWVKLSGLKFESMSDMTLSHDAKEFQAIEVTCAVDNVWFYRVGEP